MKKSILILALLITQFINAKEIHVLQINGVINPVSSAYISDHIAEANANSENIECLIIELDTPGGLMTSMRKIIKPMMNATVPIVVYVSPSGARAGSAGVFITYASDIAAMSPGTNIGAAHPVNMGPGMNFQKDTSGTEILSEKVTNDAVAFISSIAEKRNRNVEWAEKAIRESHSITEQKALELGVIEIIAENRKELLKKLDGYQLEERELSTSDAKIVIKEFGLHRKILDIISDPNVAYILMILGFWGLVFEIRNPGTVFPGVFGAICLILAFFAFQILPINYTGAALIFLAVILFILEVYVTSFGLLTVGGIIIMILGSMMLIDFTQAPRELFAISFKVIIPVVLFTAGFFIFAFSMALKALKKQVTTGSEGMVGLTGETISTVSSSGGQVIVHGEVWSANSREEIEKGADIVVQEIKNMTLLVERKR